MALQGAGDPRWVVRERNDGRNVNGWHWEDKNVSNWAKDRIKQLLNPPACTASAGDISVFLKQIESVDGDATLYNRKGVLKVLYDLKVSGKWETSHADEEGRTKGEIKFELFDEDPDVVVSIDAKSKAEHKWKMLFLEKIAPVIQEQCKIFVRELHAGAGQCLDGVSMEHKPKVSESKVTDFLRSGMSQSEKRVVKKGGSGTTRMMLEDTFTCSKADMYLGLTEVGRLQAITRGSAMSEARVGGDFMLLNGTVRGKYTKLVKDCEVGMSWKLKTWGEDAEASDVIIKIEENEEGRTLVEVEILDVPIKEKSGTEGFWRVQIFQAMKVVLGWGRASHFL